MPTVALLPILKPGEHVLCAVSGGADSVALLLLLKEKADLGEIRLTAAHFDHGIRAASAEDARFVRALCERIGVRLIEASEDVPAVARREGVGIETAARSARRLFLESARREVGADVIATAHHADDQAETVLMHLFRGAGLSGAAGIRPRRGVWVRPLLETRKEDLIRFLKAQGQCWRTDETNAVLDTPRNVLRSGILPSVLALYPGASEALCRFAKLAGEESDFLEGLADEFLSANGRRIDAGLYALNAVNANMALVRRALRKLCPKADFSTINSLANLFFQPSGRFVASGIRAERVRDKLYLIDESIPAESFLGHLCVRPAENRPVYQNGFRQVLDRAAVADASLRLRKPGDWISPLGTKGRKSLSDYLTDRKIDRPLRDRLPILARGSEVLWVVGVGISNRAALGENSEAVELTYIPKNDGGTFEP
jgi:tRNA(Ile)-lysidine synthase